MQPASGGQISLRSAPYLAGARQPLPRALSSPSPPWLTVAGLPQGPGRPLSWNNVRHGSASRGDITATQQSIRRNDGGPKVVTLYWPLTDEAPGPARRRAYQTHYAEWLPRVVAKLETYHPSVTPYVQPANFWVWSPGPLWGAARAAAPQPGRGRVFLAHTDLSAMAWEMLVANII